jgi:hypothetical protein
VTRTDIILVPHCRESERERKRETEGVRERQRDLVTVFGYGLNFQRFKLGTTTLWSAPFFVCGNYEVPEVVECQV